MIRVLIPLIAVILFFLETEFALFSPIEWNGELKYLVPRFLIIYLIFLSVYYDRKRAMLYGLIFGLLYDVFYIDIIGLYSVLYPLICFLAGYAMKFIHQHLLVTTALSLLLVALLEIVLHQFFLLISFTSMPFSEFLQDRLIPTMIANSLFLVMLGWVFKQVIAARLLHGENQQI